MTITTVHDSENVLAVTLADGTILYVPKDPANADYVRVEAWAADGGVITS